MRFTCVKMVTVQNWTSFLDPSSVAVLSAFVCVGFRERIPGSVAAVAANLRAIILPYDPTPSDAGAFGLSGRPSSRENTTFSATPLQASRCPSPMSPRSRSPKCGRVGKANPFGGLRAGPLLVFTFSDDSHFDQSTWKFENESVQGTNAACTTLVGDWSASRHHPYRSAAGVDILNSTGPYELFGKDGIR